MLELCEFFQLSPSWTNFLKYVLLGWMDGKLTQDYNISLLKTQRLNFLFTYWDPIEVIIHEFLGKKFCILPN